MDLDSACPTRRRFVQLPAGLLGASALSPLLNACSAPHSPTPTATPADPTEAAKPPGAAKPAGAAAPAAPAASPAAAPAAAQPAASPAAGGGTLSGKIKIVSSLTRSGANTGQT